MSPKLRTPQTKPSTLRGACKLILPDGIVTTAFPAVQATCAQIGINFDPWQVEINRAILAKSADGLYAADIVAMSVPRQVGKTFDIGALVFADSIINPGTTTVWTAHSFKVSRETFNELRGWAKSPLLAPHLDYEAITTAAGNECIRFRNGSRIVFAARERGAIRGFTKVRRLILDEAQILTASAMADLAPTMNQAINPQIILMGTPPKPKDPGEVFTELRKEALGGSEESSNLLWIEFAAAAGASLTDWSALADANPSFPSRTSKRAITRLRRLLPDDDDFRREVFGIWDVASRVLVFDEGAWELCAGAEPVGLPLLSLGLAVSFDLRWASLVGATEDGPVVFVRPLQHGPGSGWAVERCKALQEAHGTPVVVDERGPAAVLLPDLERAGVKVTTANTGDVLDSCAEVYGLVNAGLLRHSNYPELDKAVSGAVTRDVGDRWAWGRKKSVQDISALEAATLAAWGIHGGAKPPARSAYEARGVLTV